MQDYTDLILNYVSKRIVAYPFPIKGLPRWVLSRYRISDEKIPFIINSKEDIENNENMMRHRCRTLEHFGLYASNYRYVNNDQYYYDLPKEGNIIDYIALIDIDHARQNLDLFKEVMDIIIVPRLPKKGVYCVVSGNGFHVRIVGFKSHAHASKYINKTYGFFDYELKEIENEYEHGAIDFYTYTLLKKMKEVGMDVDLLNDVGRVSTVPYSRYKYNKDILCIPFEIKDVADYQNSWSDISNPRLPEKLDLWNREVSEEVIEFNKTNIEIKDKDFKRKNSTKLDDTNTLNRDSIPDCILKAFTHSFSDGQRRIIMLIASFLQSIGYEDNMIYQACIQRNDTYLEKLDENVVDQIVSEVLNKGLMCPSCKKIFENNEKKNQYPYLSLGKFDLCDYLKKGITCLDRVSNPVDAYRMLRMLSELVPKKV